MDTNSRVDCALLLQNVASFVKYFPDWYSCCGRAPSKSTIYSVPTKWQVRLTFILQYNTIVDAPYVSYIMRVVKFYLHTYNTSHTFSFFTYIQYIT